METSGRIDKSQEYIETEHEADDILSIAGIYGPPVPIEVINKILKGTTIDICAFSDEALGFSSCDNGVWRILIHPDQPVTARRFTACHEFYHMLKGKTGFCRNTEEGSFEERKANYFAACLLMPARWVRKYWERCDDISRLASIFDVSHSAMMWRLKGLERYLVA